MLYFDKRVLNILVIILLSFITLAWTFFIFHLPFELHIVLSIIAIRIAASFLLLKDYSLSWSKASQKTFLIKSFVYIVAFFIYMPIFYTEIWIYFLASELFLYLFSINFLMYFYYYVINKSKTIKTQKVVIYGVGHSGVKLAAEFLNTKYTIQYFIDDNLKYQNRSIDNTSVLSPLKFQELSQNKKYDLLVIAIPNINKQKIKTIYESFSKYFIEIKVLPSFGEKLEEKDLKSIAVEDLLARYPKDLDQEEISKFIKEKIILITGAGGSIGSEIARQCHAFGAKKLLLLDHSEYNLYAIGEELQNMQTVLLMQSVVDVDMLANTFEKYRPQIVIHAAAYKHVPLVEANIEEAIINNVVGTKNVIDMSVKYSVEKLVIISTDKAVRPTNVMGATKRIGELYAQNRACLQKDTSTEIVAVRFGNVLDSSGSVIPKFRSQIANGQNITVTHPDITRYFMLISEACELVLQAGAIGNGGEIFILDMGEPIKIVDLAKKMIELSGRDDIEIEFSGLRPGEKLYEELLINDTDAKTQYESITVAAPTLYDINQLNKDIEELLVCDNKLEQLKKIVPEFNHKLN